MRVFASEIFVRDWKKFWSLNKGNVLFAPYSINKNPTWYSKAWKTDLTIVERWKRGMTGMPIIDALMRECNETGYMANRGRMFNACYFTIDLNQDWRYGAYYFEEKLIDYDV